MKAFTKYTYGGPEVLRLEDVEKPKIRDGHVLIKVAANSPNPADWHVLRGKPLVARFAFGLFKPKDKIPGADFAGTVVETGRDVTSLKAGDRVYGSSLKVGAFAEYVLAAVTDCTKIPVGVGFPEMAATPIAGITALQALKKHGELQKGESILINGSTGGVGHFMVQIAKTMGAEVTAVCSSKNVGFVKQLGADHVIAYDKENVHEHTGNYDLVVDNHGNLSFKDFKRMGRRGVLVGFTTFEKMISVVISVMFSKFRLKVFTAQTTIEDLNTLAEMIRDKRIKVHIEKTWPYIEIPHAIGYIEAMHTRGKVAMVWETKDDAV